MYESINHFFMMNMECCKESIELYDIKRSTISTQCALFCNENLRSTLIHTHLRE